MAIQDFKKEVPKAVFGGKAHNLAVLTKTVGDVAQVPQGFAISPDHKIDDKSIKSITIITS